jgi:hypothetical protein
MHRAHIAASIAKTEPEYDAPASMSLSPIKSVLSDVRSANPFRMHACRFFPFVHVTLLECAVNFLDPGSSRPLRRSQGQVLGNTKLKSYAIWYDRTVVSTTCESYSHRGRNTSILTGRPTTGGRGRGVVY